MQDRSDNHHTFDGVEITPNLRVFGYDGEWGNVDPATWQRSFCNNPKTDPYFDGWYYVVWDSGKRDLANGTRMITRTPLSTDPNPNRRIGKDGSVECGTCLSVTMGTCMDADCKCHWHRDDAMNRRCNRCEYLMRQCICHNS